MRIHYKITDGTGVKRMANRPGVNTKRVMCRIGQAVRATTAKLTSEGVDYRGRPFAKYGTRRIYVPKTHKPKPKGDRRKRLRGKAPMKTVKGSDLLLIHLETPTHSNLGHCHILIKENPLCPNTTEANATICMKQNSPFCRFTV